MTPKELRELEKRLRGEPENIGLRVQVAGALREIGRTSEAVEHYRTVAVAYRDQGRTKQAIAVCKSLLEIAPNDQRCSVLLAELEGPKTPAPPPTPPKQPPPRPPISAEPAPPRRAEVLLTRLSTLDETPLPKALPYHVADPTSGRIPKISTRDLESSGEQEHLTNPVGRGSSSEIVDTTQRKRISTAEMRKLSATEPMLRSTPDPDADESLTHPMTRIPDAPDEADDPPRLPPPTVRTSSAPVVSTDTEDEMTAPHAALEPAAISDGHAEAEPVTIKRTSVDPFSTSFFSHLPVERRAAALSRFHRRTIKSRETIFSTGAANHPFVLVLRGELEILRDRKPPIPIGPGDFAGEDSLLARAPATTTVRAVTPAQVLLLLPADFYEIVGAFPALWAELKDSARLRA